jgi:DNA-binding PadR family transcriptional regulator
MPAEQSEPLRKLYRPTDKGKARKAFSEDKKIDRTAALISQYSTNPVEGIARRLEKQATKRLISPETRKALLEAAALQRQFSGKEAQTVINDTQGGPKMNMKGFGN